MLDGHVPQGVAGVGVTLVEKLVREETYAVEGVVVRDSDAFGHFGEGVLGHCAPFDGVWRRRAWTPCGRPIA